MNFRVGQVFENKSVRKTIIKVDNENIFCMEEWVDRDPDPENTTYLIKWFEEILSIYDYKEIPQKSNNFKLIFDILNGDTDTNTP